MNPILKVNMDKNNIPEPLHHLIPLVEKWGIEDDGYRDHQVFNSSIDKLLTLANSIADEIAATLNEWFCNPILVKTPNEEYLKFSVFLMAYEYAKSIIENK